MKTGVYVHIPFCEQRCYYCAFTVAVSPADTYAPYVSRLIREIELSEYSDAPETIFFGGGTPSIVDGSLIQKIVAAFPAGAKEINLEANPGTLTEPKLDQYREAGVNRISLGVQSFDDRDLKNAGRIHSAADVFRDIESIRKRGFENLSVDLIAGLPNQQLDIWKENLNWIERLRPEHVSIYMLDVEERSAWGRDPSSLPDDDVFAGFYIEAAERLAKAGYVHYEISNWAQPGFECRHNLKYWTGVPYRGFGVSAHSFSKTHRFWNTSSLKEYADQIDAGKLPVAGEEELTREMRLEEAFLIGLRRIAGFDVWSVANELEFRFPPEWFDRVCDLEDAGWIQFDGKFLRLTPAGCLLANGVTEELLWPNLL
ncbi:MAG TPA: radical SAM family heme chaperone HemW [Terriglobia bacterium]|nr:radical SAM family heme chaperone HemW [Terriglobia bacterium]